MDSNTNEQVLECLDIEEFISQYTYYEETNDDNLIIDSDNIDSNEETEITETTIESIETIDEPTDESTNESQDIIVENNQTTALVVVKENHFLTPSVVHTIKKGTSISIRSILMAMTLTIINLFI